MLKYLEQAETYYSAAQAALKSGDFAAYGQDLALMKAALDNAKNAAQGSPAASPSPSRLAVPVRQPVAGPRGRRAGAGLRLGCAGVAAVRPIDAAAPPHGHAAAAEGVRSVLTGHSEERLPDRRVPHAAGRPGERSRTSRGAPCAC